MNSSTGASTTPSASPDEDPLDFSRPRHAETAPGLMAFGQRQGKVKGSSRQQLKRSARQCPAIDHQLDPMNARVMHTRREVPHGLDSRAADRCAGRQRELLELEHLGKHRPDFFN